VEFLKSTPRPAFRINLHDARKGNGSDLTISIHYKYGVRKKYPWSSQMTASKTIMDCARESSRR
jgi:hypothetical protein